MSRSVTVGICAHNEEETIGKLLDQVLEEDINLEEIVVVVAGCDRTSEIVGEKASENSEVLLIEEEEREGQIVAQNKILEKASGDAILLLDGDGIIREESLEILCNNYTEHNVVSGREISVTDGSFVGMLIRTHNKFHNFLCTIYPRFSTHLGIFPSDLVDEFPRIILDDAYIEEKAFREDYELIYVDESVKYHKIPNNVFFFYKQQMKNWLGRFQINDRGFRHSKTEKTIIKSFLIYLRHIRFKDTLLIVLLIFIEIFAYCEAFYKYLRDDRILKWWRPH